jgi:hypothetical protein
MPVRFMELLLNLDAFRKATPTIHTLRCCNQFGKGENAGIPKLPKELVVFIEEELLALHRRHARSLPLGWAKKYRCFEGTCRTRDHIREAYPEVYEDRSEIGGLDYEFDSGSDMSMSDYTWELCFDNKNQWEHDVRTHMEDGGNNDVCTTHRGETRANQGSRSYASTSAWKPSSCTRFLTLQPLVT